MKIKYSIPFIYIYILNIDKISFKKYIQSYYAKDYLSYSQWADYLEKDFKILDNFVEYILYKKDYTYNFKLELTSSISFLIKFIFDYFIIMRKYNNILNDYIKEAKIDHKNIIKNFSKNWELMKYFFLLFYAF